MPGVFSASKGLETAFDILLRMVLDKKALADTQNGMKSVGQALDEVGIGETDLTLAAMKLAPQLEQQEKQAARLQVQWWRTQRQLRAAQYVMTSMIATGGALMAPLILGATTWAKEMEKAGVTSDKVFNRYKAATDRLKASQLEIGRTTAEALTPTLEKLATLAEKATQFAAKHPQIITAALAAGGALVTLGTLGTLITSGIKLIVDIKFVAASTMNKISADLMLIAAKNNLQAAGIMAAGGKANAVEVTAAGGLKVILARLAFLFGTLAASVGGAVVAIDLVANTVNKGKWREMLYGENWQSKATLDPWLNLRQMIAANIIGRNQGLVQQGQMTPERAEEVKRQTMAFLGLDDAIKETTGTIVTAAQEIAQAGKDAEGYKILGKLNQDLLKMARDYSSDRLKVESDLNKDLLDAAKDLQRKLASIDTDLQRDLAKMADDYAYNEIKYREDEAAKEQEVLINTQQKIQDLKRDHQKKLLELEQEHEDRVWDLAIANDALGLVLEHRRYNREREKANTDLSDSIAEARRDAQRRIAEMRRQFALEAAQRARDYERRRAEAIADAEAKKLQAQQDSKDEIEQLRANAKEKLAELQRQYDEERKQKVLAAYQDIVALGGALRAEQEYKRLYYDYMLQDAQSFVEAYRAALAQIASQGATSNPENVPTHQVGGYTRSGLARVHAGEYVLNPSTTRAAERIVGGQLTQQALLATLAGGVMNRGSVTIYDHRRFDSRLSLADRRQIDQWTMESFERMLS